MNGSQDQLTPRDSHWSPCLSAARKATGSNRAVDVRACEAPRSPSPNGSSLGVFRAIVFASAGPKVGLGHMSRALRVAGGLAKQLNALVTVCVLGPKTNYPAGGSVDVKFLENTDLIPKVSFLMAIQPSIVFLDLAPQFLPSDLNEFLTAAMAANIKLVAIDGLLTHREQLDLVFIPSFRHPASTHAQVPSEAKVIHGWDCYLLDENPNPPPWHAGPKVLALTGGSDTTQLGRTWPTLLNDRLPNGTEVDWVTGPFAQTPVWPSTPRIRMTQHLAPNGLHPQMSKINYAVTVYGVSFFELLQRGVPTVVFSPYGDKDVLELQEIEREGLALVVKDEVDATENLIALMGNEELAARLSAAAAKKLKSRGIDRLCSEVKMLLST